jgi:hypothetical protein
VKVKAANAAACELADRWQIDNPAPESKRGKKRWLRKAREYELKVIPKPWHILMTAELEFAKAQCEVALVPIAGPADLHTMAACSVIYDRIELNRKNLAPIAVMVADEIFKRGLAAIS